MGALLYHFILIYPPLPIDLEPVILPGKRSVIFSQRLIMASILLSSSRTEWQECPLCAGSISR